MFLDDVEDSWALISVLDDISLEWVEIRVSDHEKEEWVSAIQEHNRILRQGFAIEIGESWADEELERARSRVIDEKLRDLRDQRALQAIFDAEEGDIPEDEEEESEDEDSLNGEGIVWRHTHIQQLDNDDQNGDQENDRRLERGVFLGLCG